LSRTAFDIDGPRITTDCPDYNSLLEEQQAIIEMLQAQVAVRHARLEKVKHDSKRQAATYRKKRKADPKKPGREIGKRQQRCVSEANRCNLEPIREGADLLRRGRKTNENDFPPKGWPLLG
jgi:hypothetical protein